MHGKRINQVRLNADQARNQTDAEEERAQHGNSPLNMILRCPAVDEKTNGHEDTEEDQRRQAEFWLGFAIVGGCEAFENAVGSGANMRPTNIPIPLAM
jgi:hypothetical protein